ncbi:MAG: aspartyl-phosphate phosphatase Spo0E family protein [Firmicutes bacterium]|nr:aspartyl-phosphate phosphatase Spo0E family protein [Bacillota bacterium]
MDRLKSLEQRLELERRRLHWLVENYGLTSSEALAQSKHLDRIHNQINKLICEPNRSCLYCSKKKCPTCQLSAINK